MIVLRAPKPTLVAALAVLALAAPAANAAFPGANGKIAFERDDAGGRLDVWTMNPDGSGQTNLTNTTGGDEFWAVWSPDGSRIAFASGGDIWVMLADGSGRTNVTNNGSGDLDGQPTWSGDGSKIAFTRYAADTDYDIWAMNADGTGQARLAGSSATSDTEPEWSPDGTRIAWSSDEGAQLDIWVMDADGTNPRRLTNDESVDSYPNWSPDSQKIAYLHNLTDFEIFVMNADGSDSPGVNVTNTTGGNESRPAWSPDGARIAYQREDDVWVMNAEGSGQTALTSDAASRTPDWQPLPSSDLAAQKAAPGSASVGDELTYTIVASRLGGSHTADDVTVTDTLPAGVEFVSASASRGVCSGASTITCNVGALGGTASATVTIRVRATQPGTITNAVSVSSSRVDPNGANNSASASTTVSAFTTVPEVMPPIVGPCLNAIAGTDAAETLTGTADGDVIRALAGDDTVAGQAGADCVFGGTGNDRVNGDADNDTLHGEAGNDALTGGLGDDVTRGGPGADRLLGSAGADTLRGGGGNDRIDGGPGVNKVNGGGGNDNITAANGRRETIRCGAGRDKVRADATDRLRRCERVSRLRAGPR